jgi:protein-S-isoprenylcysteine O-methyltransferase Ste14
MTEENIFRLTGAILFISSFFISGYFRRKAEVSGQKGDVDTSQEKDWVYRVRTASALLGYGSILLYFIYPSVIRWAQIDLPTYVRWIGAGSMLLMMPMIYWLFSSLGNNVTPTVSIREKHELVVSGPYRYIRHPLYTFGFINMVGMSVLAANWFILAMLMIAMTAIFTRTEKEEEKLLEKFGEDYKVYMQKTGKYLPKLTNA